MKRPGILLLMAVFMISTVNLAAQKLTSGSLDALKGEKTLNVMFESPLKRGFIKKCKN